MGHCLQDLEKERKKERVMHSINNISLTASHITASSVNRIRYSNSMLSLHGQTPMRTSLKKPPAFYCSAVDWPHTTYCNTSNETIWGWGDAWITDTSCSTFRLCIWIHIIQNTRRHLCKPFIRIKSLSKNLWGHDVTCFLILYINLFKNIKSLIIYKNKI